MEALRQNVYFEGLINDLFDKFKTARSEAKKELLINAAGSAVAGLTIDEALAGRFLSLIEQFSPHHVSMLALFRDPKSNSQVKNRMENVSMGGLTQVIQAALPNAGGTIPVIFQDLVREGFVEGSLGVTMSGSGLLEKRTTATGDAFLRFVSPPS